MPFDRRRLYVRTPRGYQRPHYAAIDIQRLFRGHRGRNRHRSALWRRNALRREAHERQEAAARFGRSNRRYMLPLNRRVNFN